MSINETSLKTKCDELFNVLIPIIQVTFNRFISSIEIRFSFPGFITVQELREVLRRLNHNVSEDQLREVIRQIDTDQDGKISFEEFVRIVQDG